MTQPYEPPTCRYPRSLNEACDPNRCTRWALRRVQPQPDAEDTRFIDGHWGDEADPVQQPSRIRLGRNRVQPVGVALALCALVAVALLAAFVAWARVWV